MANEDDGRTGGDAPSGIPPVAESQPESPGPSKPATEADFDKVEKRMSGFERSTLRWTRASFIVVLATAMFIALQWNEMRTGGEDTHTLAVAAKKQAEKADSISISIGHAVEELTASATAAGAQATAAQDGVKAVTQQMRQDQRPLLKLVPSFGTTPTASGQTFEGKVLIQNIGKTPALHILAGWHIKMIPNVIKKINFDPHYVGWGFTTGALFSNEPPFEQRAFWIQENWDGEGLPPLRKTTIFDIQDFEKGNAFYILYGKATYEDGFGIKHWTRFCIFHSVAGNTYARDCTSYNQIDHNR
jgi:hypothetical protein